MSKEDKHPKWLLLPAIEDNWVTREFFKDRSEADFLQHPVFVGWDMGGSEYEAKWDPKTGNYTVIGPEQIDKRRRWQEMRDHIDRAIAGGHSPWDKSR